MTKHLKIRPAPPDDPIYTNGILVAGGTPITGARPDSLRIENNHGESYTSKSLSTPDDPVFHGRAQIFVPVSRQSNPGTKNSVDETKKSTEQVSKEANQAMSEILEDDGQAS